MEIKDLQYFIVSAEMGSFQKASEVLYTTQSHVSKVIKGLEGDLGFPLFQRKKHGVALTEYGAKMYLAAEKMLRDYAEVEKIKTTANRRVLSVSFSPSLFTAQVLAQSVAQLDPSCLCGFYELGQDQLLLHLHALQNQLAIIYLYNWQRARLEIELERLRLSFVPLAEARPTLFVRKGHPAAAASSVSEAQLRRLRFVQTAEDQALVSKYGAIGGSPLGLQVPQISVITDSAQTIPHILSYSELAYLGVDIFRHMLSEQGLTALPIQDVPACASFGYLCRSDAELSPEAALLVETLKANIAEAERIEA